MQCTRLIFVVITIAVAAASCSSKLDLSDSATIVEPGGIDPNVNNGIAFDRGTLNPAGTKKIVLPENAIVRRSGQTTEVEVFLAKHLAFVGHPGKRLSVRDARREMGCAMKFEDGALTIATFGEWDSHVEGGASMKLVFVVPEAVVVETRAGLSGERSAAMQPHRGIVLTESTTAPGRSWYGPTSREGSWAAIPTVPDPQRTAQ